MTDRTIHFVTPNSPSTGGKGFFHPVRSMCGAWTYNAFMDRTLDAEDVTCGNCRRTRAWKEAADD